MKINAVFLAAILSVPTFAAPQAQNASLLQKAHEAYIAAQSLEAELNEKPAANRTRADYLKVINAYQRVYIITPRTGYADNSLMAIAHLYEETKANPEAVKTLQFLIREYPSSPFKDAAEKDIARLNGVKVQKTVAVDNVRFWLAQNSVRVMVDLGGETTFTQGDAKNPDRVFIDISPAKLNSTLVGKQWPVNSTLLQQIRVGQYDNSTVRVVLDIGMIGRVNSFSLHEPERLVIDVLGKEVMPQPTSTPITTGSAPGAPLSAAAPPEPPKPTPASAPPSADVAAAKGPKAVVTTASQPAAIKKVSEPEAKTITPAKSTNSGARTMVRSLGLKLSRV